MKEAKKIAQKVLVLLLDILVFAWQVVRRVVLPTRGRKGNMLSSLLTFFVGLMERVVSFEKSILQRPVVFTHKYIKQGLIVAVGFLFLLSSVEWTIGLSADDAGNRTPDVVACVTTVAPVRTKMCRLVSLRVIASTGPTVTVHSFISLLSVAGPPFMGKRWLLHRAFRI